MAGCGRRVGGGRVSGNGGREILIGVRMEELVLGGQSQLGVQQQIVAGHVSAHVRRCGGSRQTGHGVTGRTRRAVRTVIHSMAVSVIEELTQLVE